MKDDYPTLYKHTCHRITKDGIVPINCKHYKAKKFVRQARLPKGAYQKDLKDVLEPHYKRAREAEKEKK